jgi:penicillin-binding protein 1B
LAVKKKGGGRKGGARKATAKGRRRSAQKKKRLEPSIGSRVGRWLALQLLKIIVLATLVGAGGGYWLYQSALRQVDAVLSRPLWKEQGKITGAVTVMPGLNVGPSAVAEVLARGGYSRVKRVEEPGDFAVQGNLVFVRDGDVDVLLTFEDGSITSVSPQTVHRFQSSELAGLGGDDERRLPISRSEMPEHLVLAVLAMEDSRFFEHGGVDAFGIARAVVVNLIGDGHKQGGSTLTQQLAKNLFLTPERTLKRKVRELALAVALEDRLSKEQILELYLNQVYLGSVSGAGVCGVAQAAATYFGTSAARLSLGQAATLAGIISAPNRFSPSRHADRAAKRRDLVLGRMVDLGWLEVEQTQKVARQSLGVVTTRGRRLAPWALDEAVARVEGKLGEGTVSEGSVSIRTTIDALLQRVAENAVREGLAEVTERHDVVKDAEVALVAIDPSNGDVLAMVGGRAYGASTFNRAVRAARQVGSTVKPLSWLALLESDPELSARTEVPDEPIEREFNGDLWMPQNYDGEFLGSVTLETALATSRNIPAVHVSEWVGIGPLADFLGRLGLDGAKPYPSTALGAFEATPMALASAYTVFPGLGRRVAPRLIRSVRLPDGTEGWQQQHHKTRVASERAAFLVGAMLQTTMEEGTGRRAAAYGVSGNVGGKTGTTDGGRDAWFVGSTPHLAVAVWVGFDKGRDLGLTGAQAALPIWARFVAGSGRMDDGIQSPPKTVASVTVCTESGDVAVEACPDTEQAWASVEAGTDRLCATHDAGPLSGTRSILQRIRDKLRPNGQRNRGGHEPKD